MEYKIARYHRLPTMVLISLLTLILLSTISFWSYQLINTQNIEPLLVNIAILAIPLCGVVLILNRIVCGLFLEHYIFNDNGVRFKNFFITWKEIVTPKIIVKQFKGSDRLVIEKELNFADTKRNIIWQDYLFIGKIDFSEVKRIKWYDMQMDFVSPTSNYFVIPLKNKKVLEKLVGYIPGHKT